MKKIDLHEIEDLILQQYKNADRLRGIIQGDIKQGSDLQDAFFDIRDEFWLDTAIGTQLDVIGSIQDAPRLGLNDDDYRNAIRTKIIINQGSGEPETIITAFRFLYGAGLVQLVFSGNANLQVFIDVFVSEEDIEQITRIIPAGVNLSVVVFSDDSPFGFLSDDFAKGFGYLGFFELEFDDGSVFVFDDDTTLTLIDNVSDDSADAGRFSSVSYIGE